MAINRKGMRKIIVGDSLYYYKIYFIKNCGSSWGGLRIVIEHPDETVTTHTKDWYKHDAFTPADVEKLIEEEVCTQQHEC